MSTFEIVTAFRNIAHTLNTVTVTGEENLDKVLGTIRYARNIASVLEQEAAKQETQEEAAE